jgi:hypothetical protein
MGGKEPMHANFATRVSHAIGDRIVQPVAYTMALTGVGLIWSAGIDPFAAAYRWLLVAIAIYVFAVLFAVFVQRRAVMRVIELTGGHGGTSPATPPSPSPDAAGGGPPPALAAAVASVQRNGIVMTLALVVIVFLMIVKPSLGA